MRHAVEEDFGFAVEDGHRGIKGRGVFRETLSGIEGEKSERAGVVAENFARTTLPSAYSTEVAGTKTCPFSMCAIIYYV